MLKVIIVSLFISIGFAGIFLWDNSLSSSSTLMVSQASHCPDVDKLHCIWTPGPGDRAVQTSLALPDGTECPACHIGLPQAPGHPRPYCPPLPCPMWLLEDNCKPRFYSLYFIDGRGKKCPACDTYVCLKQKKTQGSY